jgi:hypothetical protein
MMHLRQPIVPPKNRPLAVLIHARFSTEEQRQSSIDDQVDACRAFLTSGLPKGTKPSQVTVEVIKEPEVSGEIADRPGINQMWADIEANRWDVIIAEESSRLYRHRCGSPMYSYGKQDGHFRCSSAVSGNCWYRGYRMRERAFPAVLEAVVNEVLSLDGVRDTVLARVRELHEQGGSVAAELKKLDKEEKKLGSAIERLSAAVESGDGSLASLTSRLADRERELAIVRSRRREVEEPGWGRSFRSSARIAVATSAHCLHHGAGTDPEDSRTPRRTARATTSLAGPGTAHRLGRVRAGPRRARRLPGVARRAARDRHSQPLSRAGRAVKSKPRTGDPGDGLRRGEKIATPWGMAAVPGAADQVPENAAPASPAAHRLGNASRHRCGSAIGRTTLPGNA